MTQELMKVSNLHAPTVSGTVKISLAEMDKLRLDYVAAVKLAQDLESKQSMIKIVYSKVIQTTKSIEDTIWDPEAPDNTKTITRYVPFEEIIDRVEYKNMEGVLTRLRLEAKANVQKEIDLLTSAKSSSFVDMITAEVALQDYKEDVTKLKTKLKRDHKVEILRLDKQYKDDHIRILELRRKNRAVEDRNNSLISESDRVLKLCRELTREMSDNSIKGIWNRLFY